MPSIKSLPTHLRPREKLLERGSANLTDRELLAILLRTGRAGQSALDIASNILRKHKLTKLLDITLDQLKKIKGISTGKATTILAAFELTRRATQSFDNTLPILSSPQDSLDQLTSLRNKKKEHFVSLYLNARNQLIHKETISIGTLTASLVHPREVFAPALIHNAASIIVAHNHPSGDIEPSVEDRAVKVKLHKAGLLLGIELIDHLILTSTSHRSLREQGQLTQ